ncbi:lactate utilization protein C [Kitasatospora sp. NPDC096147]|uniref:LutC/YkgG family protein n=1 Tax=Kitasatospora sp. NPDC096147 TaxID=3364093 RepID=UPI0037F65238
MSRRAPKAPLSSRTPGGAGDSRTLVLERIRAALADVPPGETPKDVPVPRDYRRSHADGDLVELFAERVADYRATVLRCTPGEAAETIRRTLAGHGHTRVVVPPGFPPEIHPGPAAGAGQWWWPGPGAADETESPEGERQPGVAELESAHAVVSTAAVAIALTGTIVLDAGLGQGRRVLTLLPDHHLCVVRASQILADVPEALSALDPTRPLTFVSGPSATSDIELDRVEGVHGPRVLEVLIVDDRA